MQRRAAVLLSLFLAVAPPLSSAVLWFGDKDGLHQIDASTNRVALNVAFETPVAIAVNAADGSVWVLTQNRIAHLDQLGGVRFQALLRDLGSGLGAPRLLALNPNDASVWAGFENRVLHFDADGIVRNTLATAADDFAVGQDGSLWILGQSFLQQHDAAGAMLNRVAANPKAKYLALDDTGGAIWLAGEKDLIKVGLSNPSQTLLSLSAPETIAGISIDVQSGELWVLGQNGLFSYGRDGAAHVSRDLRDFSIANARAVVFDFGSQAVWVGHQRGLSRITTGGALAASFDAAVQVGTIAIGKTPVDITPVVTILAPPNGSLINNNRPQFRVDYDALCGGVSCGFPNSFFSSFSLSALLNGVEVGASFVFDPSTGGATFTPSTPLPEGLSSITVQARDSFGGVSDPASSSFTVDTIAPAFVNVAPPSGSEFTSASITITGSVNDPQARVTLGTQEQGATFSFAVVLIRGVNNLTLVARDLAGNTTPFPLTYTFEPPNVPPTVQITAPVNGANFEAPASFAVDADARDSDGTIVRVEFFSNGNPAGTDTTFPYSVSLTNLGIGTYSLTARATDNRNGSTTSDPVSVSVGPPNALPTVELKSPANGTAFSAPASVKVVATAADSDGTVAKVEFFRNGALAATDFDAPYEATLTNVPAGSHSITARATDDRNGATTSAPRTITVSATTIVITSPAPNASIGGDSVLVTGRITALANSGVSVNDDAAALDAAGNFYAIVALTPGPNSIAATLTTPDGTMVTQSINVTATGEASPFVVAATPIVGLAPLIATFTVHNPTAADATFMFDTFGPFLLPAGAAAQLSVTYPAGVFVPNIVITDSASRSFGHRIIIDSRDENRMDQMFRAIWAGMNNALLAGDKEGALRYLNGMARRKFGPAFDVLMPFMSQIIGSYSPLAKSSIKSEFAEYAVVRPDGTRKRLYMIYFLLDVDGVWRIDEM